MNENYIIDGNAVYEIDMDCCKDEAVGAAGTGTGLPVVHRTEEDSEDDWEKVSVFF